MNDFIRPTLYNAHHNVEPVNLSKSGLKKFDIVGPICETGDYFAKDALLSNPTEGQLLAIFSTGAYGSVMSSNYNSRVPANEILVHTSDLNNCLTFGIEEKADYKFKNGFIFASFIACTIF